MNEEHMLQHGLGPDDNLEAWKEDMSDLDYEEGIKSGLDNAEDLAQVLSYLL